jgi:hypothetical protein
MSCNNIILSATQVFEEMPQEEIRPWDGHGSWDSVQWVSTTCVSSYGGGEHLLYLCVRGGRDGNAVSIITSVRCPLSCSSDSYSQQTSPLAGAKSKRRVPSVELSWQAPTEISWRFLDCISLVLKWLPIIWINTSMWTSHHWKFHSVILSQMFNTGGWKFSHRRELQEAP